MIFKKILKSRFILNAISENKILSTYILQL
jgi:hypothetical protein